MSQVKLTADSGGGTIALKAPASTTSDADVQLTLPVADGSADQYLKTNGSGTLSWATVSAAALTGSTDNTITTVTGANAIQGEANLTYDGSILKVATDASTEGIECKSTGNTYQTISLDSNRSGSEDTLGRILGKHNGNIVSELAFGAGTDTTNKDEGTVWMATSPTGSSLQMRLKATKTSFEAYRNGDLLIDGDNQGSMLYFQDKVNTTTSGIPFRFGKANSSITTNERHNMISFSVPGNNRGIIQTGSSVSEAPALAASSDYRIKTNFRNYTGGWDVIKAIPIQLYDENQPNYAPWDPSTNKSNVKGWAAHVVEAVLPEAVTGTKDAVITQAQIDAGEYKEGQLGQIIAQELAETALIPDIVGALQQAMAKIETLETKVAALEAG